VFKGTRIKDRAEFGGWWTIDALRVVEPQSDELRELLQVKEQAKSYKREGRSWEAWNESLSHTWIKLRLSPAPAKSEHYDELKDPMSLVPGREVERYLLQVGGLADELRILDDIKL